jgi:hypothetical protein
MRTLRNVALAAVALGLVAGGQTARATVTLQNRAKVLGFPATDCNYCHTFGRDHMVERARAMGIQSVNCIGCHGSKLPKSGKALYNDRGLWLLERKAERKASRCDMSWLADYKEPKKPLRDSTGLPRGEHP